MTEEQQQLAIDHIFLLRPIACAMARNLPPRTEVEELMAEGALGLIRAAVEFDGTRGMSFRSFARKRIEWAIIDRMRSGPGLLPIPSIDRPRVDEETGEEQPLEIAARSDEDPLQLLLRAEWMRRLSEATSNLSEYRQLLIYRHFVNGEKMSAIAEERGLSRSAVAAVMAHIRSRLRAVLRRAGVTEHDAASCGAVEIWPPRLAAA